MLLALPLALLLSSSPDGRGAAGTLPEDAAARRTQPRLRASLGGALLFGLAEYAPSFGVGLSADAGVVLDDRLSFLIHAEAGSIVFTFIGSLAAVVEYTLNDHFSAGVGLAMTLWAQLAYGLNLGQFVGPTVPLRLNFSPGGRASNQTAYQGLLLGLQVAPGFSLLSTNASFGGNARSPGLAATFTVSTAWW